MQRLEKENTLQTLKPTTVYDLCLAWEWRYDSDFVLIFQAACHSQGLSLLVITPENIESILPSLHSNQITFRAFLDRASDTDDRFVPLTQLSHSQSVYRINPYGLARRAWDKATSHISFTNAGLPAPYTIFLPSYQEQPYLTPIDLNSLGSSFSIKPAHGGGGRGVVVGVTRWEQVMAARWDYPSDNYLLQTIVTPTHLETRAAWFRILYCSGDVYPCWWDTHTHVYTPLSPAEESRYSLAPLREIVESIARLSKLQLFSTEIALTTSDRYVIVDYINDPVDLRLQSKAYEGVPDEIVIAIANRLALLVASHCS